MTVVPDLRIKVDPTRGFTSTRTGNEKTPLRHEVQEWTTLFPFPWLTK